MAYDEGLAERVRKALAPQTDVVEMKMFGGLCLLKSGNMCCGVHGDSLIVRMSPECAAAALRRKHTRPFDMTGRPMKGFVVVAPAGVRSAAALAQWVRQGVDFAASLPAK